MLRYLSLFFLAAVLYFATAPISARAEYCPGTEGRVGYVYIPATQLWLKRKGTLHDVDPNGAYGDHAGYEIANGAWLFSKPGLPRVNEEVALAVTTPLLTVDEIGKNNDIRQDSALLVHSETHTAEPTVPYYNINAIAHMPDKTRLRILSYQTISAPSSGAALFALVLVIKDGDPKLSRHLCWS